jgi:FkbM family methyltransferase
MKTPVSNGEFSPLSRGPGITLVSDFLRRPWPKKLHALRFRFKRVWGWLFPSIPLPLRIPENVWWLAYNDVCGDAVFTGNFEEGERRFVARFLREGMTVLDLGAHHGLYTMAAARKVGREGRVIAFEPSPREYGKLLRHLRLNRLLKNVTLSPLVVNRDGAEGTLFVVEGRDTGCNSLRPPDVAEPTKAIRVRGTALDTFLKETKIRQVDFIKMDVEGAELDVLEGATELLSRYPRPVILTEVADSRTAPWGYAASAIYDFLAGRGYQWFAITRLGALVPFPRTDHYSANLVAFPGERLPQAKALLQPDLEFAHLVG